MSEVLIFTLCIFLVYSCDGQLRTTDTCREKFKAARELAYANPTRQPALDSALYLTDECMKCDSIRKAVVDFKVTLLVSMKRYAEGIKFIGSLKEGDFTYAYKQNFMSKGLQALVYNSKDDTTRRNMVYKEIANDIERYIKNRSISDKEFKEIYTDLFAVKEHYLDVNQMNSEVEVLKKIYPEKKDFFDFFKSEPTKPQ